MKTIKIFSAIVMMASMSTGCMSMRSVYVANDNPYVSYDGIIESKFINLATDQQIERYCQEKADQGLVEIGRGERIEAETLSIGECLDIAKEHKGVAVLCYTQYVSREMAGVYMVTDTFAAPIYDEVYRNVLIVFGKQKSNAFGLSLGSLTESDMRLADTRTGAKVLYVRKDSAAWDRCFFSGDIITKINGKTVRDKNEAEVIMETEQLQDFELVRDGRLLTK